ncbi:MAG TPA: alpha/beta fold hydrolase [Chloroflexi bacterium]|nr:alpha/beta fold hydrolase [Chloroflexota bacterium]
MSKSRPNSTSLTYMSGAEPRLLRGNHRLGVLMVHGFVGTPAEILPLTMAVAAEGYTVLSVRLSGHGTHVRDMQHTRWMDWVMDVADGLHILSGLCDEIVLCGFSMGGTLSLLTAAHHPQIKAVIAIESPLRMLPEWLIAPLQLLSLLLPAIAPLPVVRPFMSIGKREEINQMIAASIGYHQFATRGFAEILKLLRYTRQQLATVTAPALLIHSRADDVVDFANVKLIQEGISSTNIQTLYLEKSLHNVILGPEAPQVIQAVVSFLHQCEEGKA